MPGSSNRDLPIVVIRLGRAEGREHIYLRVYGRGRKGHYIIKPNGDTYIIPYGFASGDELRYSDAAILNLAIHDGLKDAAGVVEYCL
jgi:hypothetical protein